MAKAQTDGTPRLTGVQRTGVGTSPARRLRARGFIPGIVYGKAIEPIAIAVKAQELARLLSARAGEHALITLCIEDDSAPAQGGSTKRAGRSWENPVLVKALQHDPVDGGVVHVDFQTIVLTERLRVKVSVELSGEPIGVKQDGGVLEHFLREIEVECLPTAIPERLGFDMSQLKIGDVVHVKDLTPPAGAKITSDLEGVIASVQRSKVEKVEEAPPAAEPEVIHEKKETAAEAEAAKAEEREATKEEKGKKEET